MGAAASTNTVQIISDAVTTISGEAVNKSASRNDQSILINIADTKGNVTISDTSITQTSVINMKSLYLYLNSKDSTDKINQKIEQNAKALISDLNLVQIGVSASTLDDIIKNTIDIKDKVMTSCFSENKQRYTLKIVRTEGNVNIDNLSINQFNNSITECINNVSSNMQLRKETDTAIKQIADTAVKGLTVETLLLYLALGIGGTSVFAAKTLMGPILMAGGAAAVLFSYTKPKFAKPPIKKTIVYIKNSLDYKFPDDLLKIKTEAVLDDDDFSQHGDFDVFESFGGNVICYAVPANGKFKMGELYDDIKSDDVVIKPVGTDTITIGIFQSEKYKVSETFGTIKIPNGLQLAGVRKINNESEIAAGEYRTGNVFFIMENLGSKHEILIKYIDQQNALKNLSVYYLNPTIVGYKDKTPESFNFKNPIFLIGIATFLVGAAVTVFTKTNKSSSNK